MAGILPNFSNLGVLIGSLYPVFIVCFLVLASIFNQQLNGIIYLTGIIFTLVLCYFVSQLGIFSEKSRTTPLTCDLFSIASTNYMGPSSQAAISWFTFIYLLWPMIPPAQSSSIPNPMIIIATSVFALTNNIFQWRQGCSNVAGILLGAAIGIALGSAWFWLWWMSGHKDLLFYNELVSNNAICKRPSQQSFKCEVWKGGKLITESTL